MKSILFLSLFFCSTAFSDELKVGDPAPLFKAKNQAGKDFDLKAQKGKWTVLFFYPKAETPGCTKEVCAFRDGIKKIEAQGAKVFGISADTVEAQAGFHRHHNLNFPLLADPEAKVIQLYGSMMEGKNLSRRWTFLIDKKLMVRSIEKNVDPLLDAERVAKEISTLKKETK